MFSLSYIVTLSNFDSFWPHRPTWLRIKAWVYRKSFTNRLWWHRVRCWLACKMYWDLHPLLGDTITSLISGTLPGYFRYRSEVINRDWTILLSIFSRWKERKWTRYILTLISRLRLFFSPYRIAFRGTTKSIRYSMNAYPICAWLSSL